MSIVQKIEIQESAEVLRELLTRRWIRVCLVNCSLLLIIFVTLYPFNFSSDKSFSIQYLFRYFYHPSNFRDFLLNIVLFMPLGFSLTSLLPKKKIRWIIILFVVLIINSSLSFAVELLQVFLPSRASTVSDIVANSFGSFLGFLCFYFLYWVVVNNSEKVFSLKGLAVCFISYLSLTFLLSMPLSISTNLDNWNSNFPLLLGNETTGTRPWQGYISELYIADKAISPAEITLVFSKQISWSNLKDHLVTAYQLNSQDKYIDLTGHLPKLSWQGEDPKFQGEQNVLLTPSNWLTTKTPANSLTNKIRQTSEFTIVTTIATANKYQTGPARIVSLSGNSSQRNFTIAQDKTNLIFRLRTPITGKNGANPELVVPGIFTDTKPHHLIITYSDSLLQIYVDKIKNCHYLELTPLVTILSFIFPDSAYDLKSFSQLIYYGVIFIPLGLLLGLINIIWRGGFMFKILLICNGIFLPALLLEGILVSGTSRNISVENLGLSWVIVFITIFFLLLFLRGDRSE